MIINLVLVLIQIRKKNYIYDRRKIMEGYLPFILTQIEYKELSAISTS